MRYVNKSKRVVFFLVWVHCVAPALGYVLDFDDSAITWTPGSTSKTFTNVDGSGIDITLTITGDLEFDSGSYPSISSTYNGGTGENALALFMDWNWVNDEVTITLSFSEDVQDVGFTVFDIDQGDPTLFVFRTYVDEISGISATDSSSNPASYSATYNSSYIGSSGGAYYGKNGGVGNSSGDGNLGINFGTDSLNTLSFVYGNGSGAWFNPDRQVIAIHDITFNPVVPEVSTSWVMIGLLGFCLFKGRLSSSNHVSDQCDQAV